MFKPTRLVIGGLLALNFLGCQRLNHPSAPPAAVTNKQARELKNKMAGLDYRRPF